MSNETLDAATEAMLVEHMNKMASIQQVGFDRFIHMSNIQTRAIDRVLTDMDQRLGHLIVPDVPVTDAQKEVAKAADPIT